MKAQLPRLVGVWYAAFATATLAVILALGTSCRTTSGAYDPVKSEAVVAAFTFPVQETIRRVILNSPQNSTNIASYFRAVGNVTCRAKATSIIDPDQLLTEVDRVTGPLQQGLDPIAITTKNVIVLLYRQFYIQRHQAQLGPEKWPIHVLDVACRAIDGGLTDAGHPGVDWKQ